MISEQQQNRNENSKCFFFYSLSKKVTHLQNLKSKLFNKFNTYFFILFCVFAEIGLSQFFKFIYFI